MIPLDMIRFIKTKILRLQSNKKLFKPTRPAPVAESAYSLRDSLRLRRFLPGVLMSSLIILLVAQAWSGNRGLKNLVALSSQSELERAELVSLKAKNEDLYANIRRLQPGSVDWDFLEERAREELEFVNPKDRIIFVEPKL